MRLILNEFQILNSNDVITKNMMSEMENLLLCYGAIVGFTDPIPPLLDISTDEWMLQLIVDLSLSQWNVDLTTVNDGNDEAKFEDEILMRNAMGPNIVQPNYVRLLLPGNHIIKKPDSVVTLRSGASYTYSHWKNELKNKQTG